MEWRAKQMAATQLLTPVSRGLYEGQLVVWDVPDAHGDVFSVSTDFYIYGEPYVFLEHNYFNAPVGRIIYHVQRDDGLYVGIKLDFEVEDEFVEGLHLSVGGFARGHTRDDGYFQITQFAVFEASLTRTPAQPNKQLVLLMKTIADMATENEKVAPENAGAQSTQKEAPQPAAEWDVPKDVLAQLEVLANELAACVKTMKSGKEAQGAPSAPAVRQKAVDAPPKAGYFRKQDLAQLEAFVNELAARVEAMESLQAQVAELQQRVADLAAAVSQMQGLTQEAVAQSVQKALKAVEEQVQPLAKELSKTMLLVSEALKKTNTQRI